jgi:hypothetical protein
MEDDPKAVHKSRKKRPVRNPRSKAELHADDARRRLWEDPAFRQRVMENRRRTAATPEEFQRKSQTMKRRWADPEERKRQSEAIRRGLLRPEVRKANSERNKRRWADPELRKRQSENFKRIFADPQVRKRISDGTKRGQMKPGVRERIGMASKRSWAKDPARRHRHSELTKRMWAERYSKLASAWRPVDWWDKPTDYRILATELMARDGMTNRELAERLDGSRILKCPYAATWKDALSTRGFLLLVNNVRKWIKRQGGRKRAVA